MRQRRIQLESIFIFKRNSSRGSLRVGGGGNVNAQTNGGWGNFCPCMAMYLYPKKGYFWVLLLNLCTHSKIWVLSRCHSRYLSIYLSFFYLSPLSCLPQSFYIFSLYLPINLSLSYQSIYLSVSLSLYQLFISSNYLSLSTNLPIYLPLLFVRVSLFCLIYLSLFLSLYTSFTVYQSLSLCLFVLYLLSLSLLLYIFLCISFSTYLSPISSLCVSRSLLNPFISCLSL